MTQDFDPSGKNPFELFNEWLEQAMRHEPSNPNAMCLATVSASGRPSNRMVLLRGHSPEGFVFYSNDHSRKGGEMAENNFVAACFYWKSTGKQIRIEGHVEKTPQTMVEEYFHSRPRGSQIASYASAQSQPLSDKQIYIDKFNELNTEYEGQDEIPCPPHWNGYRIIPSAIEFWVEGEYRMHDRFVFTHDGNGNWQSQRLYP